MSGRMLSSGSSVIVKGIPQVQGTFLADSEAEIMPKIRVFVAELNRLFPEIPVNFQDERYTSSDAKRIILASGIPKMKRRDKTLVDKISASIILTEWMEAEGKWARY